MKTRQLRNTVSRRDLLKSLGAAGAGLVVAYPCDADAAGRDEWRSRILAYLQSLAQPDGGCAWADQEESHLTPTFAVVGCYHLLGEKPPAPAQLAAWVRAHHPFALKKGEREIHCFEFQQVQSLRWLDEDAKEFREAVSKWTKPTPFTERYETHRFPIFQNEMAAFTCRELLGLPLSDLKPEFIRYLDERRRANGSFNNTPADDGSDGHVMNTWWGLQGLRALSRLNERRDETIAWLRSCQRPSGGFAHAPKPAFGDVESLVYTWAAVRALHELGAAPARREECLNYLHSLQNPDGSFGDQPGWLGNPVATYYALDALAAMDALNDRTFSGGRPLMQRRPEKLPDNLRVFTAQVEAHGKGSPLEAVALASALRIHLWGAKNAEPGWLAKAQALADQQRVPVKFFVANEEYNTLVSAPGFGTYSHTSDIIAPAGADIGPSLASAGEVTWEEFRKRRLEPLKRGGGWLVWQFGENEELTRAYFDDSLKRGGYAAISTFHFGNPDFTNFSPYLRQYRGQIPFIGLQDAHGNEPWWFADMTTGFRTLFLATEPTWEGWVNALRRNWVAAVRHDAVSGQRTWMHAGSDEVVEFVRQRETEWRWWNNPAIQRPPVSLVALRPEDEFEAGRPERGVMLRVRCQWDNTTQGLAKRPVVELVSLLVDGEPVKPELVRKGGPATFQDVYHRHPLPSLSAGRHTATVTVRKLAGGQETSRTIEFVV